MAPGFEFAWAHAQHFVLLVPGDRYERPVDVHDHAVGIRDQYTFQCAVEHGCGQAQMLQILIPLRPRLDADEPQQPGPGKVD